MQCLLVALALCCVCAMARAGEMPIRHIKDAQEKPDFGRLPRFTTSDAGLDAFANEWFQRHLSVDERGIYLGGGPILGATDHLWVIEWDWWMLPWIDRGAMGLARQGDSPVDVPLTTLLNTVVDKYGYTWGARLVPEPKESLGGWVPTFGWPWPKYNRNTTVKRPTGWEFNDPADGARPEWTGTDIAFEPGYVDHSLVGKVAGPRPQILTPEFDVDVFQVPILELDIAYKAPAGQGADRLVDGLRVYWSTDREPGFSEERSVGVDFADLPPGDFAQDYAPYVSGAQARYPLYFPMYLHPEWGREGRHITRLKVVPAGPGAEGATVSLNYVRASYDVRLSTSNATLINATGKFFLWSGDEELLAAMMPKLRRSMLFLNEHLRGRQEGLLCFDWMVGKDGLGGNEPGRGLIGSYWDLLPAGRFDIESSAAYYYALRTMAELERVVARRGIKVPEVKVLGPDNKTWLSYREAPRSLDALAAKVKREFERRLWVKETGRFCRNIDAHGRQHDYGFLHFNLLALAFGLGTEAQRASILSWLDGRAIADDTATGKDIYRWRFGPRTTTRRNESYYFWPWNWEKGRATDHPNFVWGQQMQDGGGVPFTGLFDLMARNGSGRQAQIDRAYERTREMQGWFIEVKAAGGKGRDFYRAYYDGHPERGIQQSPNPGGLGLDREFLSDASLGTTFLLYAFLGVDTREDGVLTVAPAIPTQLARIGVENVYFRGNHLSIEAGRGYVSFEASRIPKGEGLKARVTLRDVPEGARLLVAGKPWRRSSRRRDGSVTVLVPLRPVRIEVAAR